MDADTGLNRSRPELVPQIEGARAERQGLHPERRQAELSDMSGAAKQFKCIERGKKVWRRA
jgi:hypothetical protein